MVTTWVLVVWFVMGTSLPTPATPISEFLAEDHCRHAGELFVANAPQHNVGNSFGLTSAARFTCVPKGLYKQPTYTN